MVIDEYWGSTGGSEKSPALSAVGITALYSLYCCFFVPLPFSLRSKYEEQWMEILTHHSLLCYLSMIKYQTSLDISRALITASSTPNISAAAVTIVVRSPLRTAFVLYYT
jgi:hypothetical protein